jgi:hypothetical protein
MGWRILVFLSITYNVMLSIRDQLFCQRKGPGVPVRKRKKQSFVVAEYTRILKLIIYIFYHNLYIAICFFIFPINMLSSFSGNTMKPNHIILVYYYK